MPGKCDIMKSLLYDPAILEGLDFTSAESYFNPKITASNPGSGFLVRPLSVSDFDAGKLFVLLSVIQKNKEDI